MTRRTERLFFSSFAVISAVIVFVGFADTFYFRGLTDHAPLPPLVVLHGIVFTGWIALLLTQTTLVATGRTAVHRQLGVAGAWLAGAMVVIGWLTAMAAVRRGFIAGGNAGVADPLAGLALSLRDLFAFAGFVAAGLYCRRQVDVHKRLLVLATINLLPAAVGRMPISPSFLGPLIVGLVLSGAAWDWFTRGRVHPTYVWGGALTILTMLAAFPMGRTATWHRVAAWLAGWAAIPLE